MPAKPAQQSQLRVGISGWTFKPWRGVFYPPKLPQKQELHYASRQLNSIEINGTFYSLQRPSTFQTWFDTTPDDFVFSLKGPEFITHRRRLRDVEGPLANFFASGVFALKHKLGPILWQLPPNLTFAPATLETFVQLLPQDCESAQQIARKHEDRMNGRVHLEIDANRPLRHAIEIRNDSFNTPGFIQLLRKHNVGLVIADTAGRWQSPEDVTADFVYIRLHGEEELYASGYTPAALDSWAEKIRAWSAGAEPPSAAHWSDNPAKKMKSRDLFVYFDNSVKVKSPFDAMSLGHRLGAAARGVERQDESSAPPEPKLTKQALSERVRSHWPKKSLKQS
jgi:uncharacterized protein YecE (DUF72 family)